MGEAKIVVWKNCCRPNVKVLVRCCSLLAVAFSPTLTLAQSEAERTTIVSARLELTLPDNCGSPDWFLERIRIRSDRIRFHPDEQSMVVRAQVMRTAAGRIQAKMTLRQRDGTLAARSIEAADCEQALDGLALVTAVTLDPTALARQNPSEATLGPKASTPKPPETKPAPTTFTKTADAAPPALKPLAANRPRSWWDISLGGTGVRGPAPGWMVGAEGSIRATWSSVSPLSPSLRLSVSVQQDRGFKADGGIADFSLVGVAFDSCPFTITSGPVELRGCAVGVVGMLTSSGRVTASPEIHHRPWYAAGASGTVDVLLGNRIALPLRAFALFPALRDTYQFSPSAFYRTPVVSFGLTASLSVRFR